MYSSGCATCLERDTLTKFNRSDAGQDVASGG